MLKLRRNGRLSFATLGLALLISACDDDSTSPPPVVIGNQVITGSITANRTLSADTVYQLQGIVQVTNGATLTIPAGTKLTGSPISDVANRVSALVVMRGARLNVQGTAARPVVFTSAAAGGAADPRYPGDWGGIVIVGNATSNRTGRVVVEGPSPVDTIGWTNGATDSDNSGSLQYMRVEFAGAAAVLNSELNSLSFYAVGRGTRVENVQAVMGLDDHFEWFGGTVDGRNLVSYEAGDDHFDSAEGYRGRNQFLIALQSFRTDLRPGSTGAVSTEQNGFEIDGCGSTSGTCAAGYNSTPFNMPVFANFTMIGTGPGVLTPRAAGDGGLGVNIRRGTGGAWVNGIFARYPERAISIFDAETDQRLSSDSLAILNVLFAENAANYDVDAPTAPVRYAQAAKFAASNHRVHGGTTSSLFTNLFAAGTIPTTATLDWRPTSGSAAASGGLTTFPARVAARVQGWTYGTLVPTAYVGAADPNGARWWEGWTTYARN